MSDAVEIVDVEWVKSPSAGPLWCTCGHHIYYDHCTAGLGHHMSGRCGMGCSCRITDEMLREFEARPGFAEAKAAARGLR